jgi:hypothetical protein
MRLMRSGRFICKGCGAQYTVIKRSFPSDSVQRCELCELVFPAKDAGDWLRYYRSPPLPGPESA